MEVIGWSECVVNVGASCMELSWSNEKGKAGRGRGRRGRMRMLVNGANTSL